MIQNLMLKDDDDLLILGAKSGYIAALAHQLAPNGKIKILEANSLIAKITSKNLSKINLQKNIEVIVKNPLEGLPELKPWQKILVTGSIKTHRIYSLLNQLDPEHGVLFAPIGEDLIQTYTQIIRDSDQYFAEEQLQVRFTPLITQLEIDEFQLITDHEVLEKEDNENEASEENKISLKYVTNTFDLVRKSEFSGKTSEIKPVNIYIAFLEFMNQSIEELKYDKGLKNWLNSINNFDLILQMIKNSKDTVKIEVGDMEKSLKYLKNQNKAWLELEKKIIYKESYKTEKIKILDEHLLEIENFQKMVAKQLKKLH
jgi:protein-L-isoaspartate O-methyltransferase